MSEVNTSDTESLVAALEARQATLSPGQKARLSAVAAATEARGGVADTVAGDKPAPSGQPQAVDNKPPLALEQMAELLTALEDRFNNTPDHYNTSAFYGEREGIVFAEVKTCLENDPALARTVYAMLQRGGKPDVLRRVGKSFLFFEAAKETCQASRDCVYDKKTADWLRAKRPPEQFNGSVEEQRVEMGAGVMSQALWRKMQRLGIFTTDGTDGSEWVDLNGSAAFVQFASRGGRDLEVVGDIASYHNPFRGWRAVAKGSKA